MRPTNKLRVLRGSGQKHRKTDDANQQYHAARDGKGRAGGRNVPRQQPFQGSVYHAGILFLNGAGFWGRVTFGREQHFTNALVQPIADIR